MSDYPKFISVTITKNDLGQMESRIVDIPNGEVFIAYQFFEEFGIDLDYYNAEGKSFDIDGTRLHILYRDAARRGIVCTTSRLWYYHLVKNRAFEALLLIKSRIILTLVIWHLAAYRVGSVPQWRDIRWPRKLELPNA